MFPEQDSSAATQVRHPHHTSPHTVRAWSVRPPDGAAPPRAAVVLKLLLPEKETGHVIGKGGSVLTKIKTDSGARIRISAIDEVLPVTRERVCTIVGTLPAVLLAQKLISAALLDNVAPRGEETSPLPMDRLGSRTRSAPWPTAGVTISRTAAPRRGLAG